MSQSLAKIYIHLVFSTKGRTDTIPKQHLAEVHAYVAEIFKANTGTGTCFIPVSSQMCETGTCPRVRPKKRIRTEIKN